MERAQELIQKYLDGVAVTAELTELEVLLAERPDVADAFAAATRLDSFLRQSMGQQRGIAHLQALLTPPEPAQANLRPFPHGGRQRLFWGAAAVAAGLLLVTGVAFLLPGGGSGARVLSGRALVNEVESNQIGAGAKVQVLGEQNAVLRLQDGSRIELTPATEAVLRGRNGPLRESIQLLSGGGKFEVTHGAGEFEIETIAGVVTVLGTSFTLDLQTPEQVLRQRMRVRPDWKLTVSVTSGRVQVRQDADTTIVGAGRSRTFVKESTPDFVARIDGFDEKSRRINLQVHSRRVGPPITRARLLRADNTVLVNMDRLEKGQIVLIWVNPDMQDTAALIVLKEAPKEN